MAAMAFAVSVLRICARAGLAGEESALEQPHHALDVDEPLMLVVNLKRYLAWHAEW